ncbi:MAG: RtcB family protein [Candidatus Omnitrophica bacterium]|nr:RtcB family protein [Candidatus Omnitrophota bacterium]
MRQAWEGPLEKIDDYRWRIPQSYDRGMRVPGLIFASEKLLKDIVKDQSLQQVANVAHLPGIVNASLAMPDIHWGYGFPIGGVAAMDPETGVISPGGVGYDINCGVRLMKTDLTVEEVQPKLRELVVSLFRTIPCGVGMSGDIRFAKRDASKVMAQGSRWAVAQGHGVQADLEHTESHGCLEGADPEQVSERAVTRGQSQLGTLGSGNHFLEVQAVETVFDEGAANAFGIAPGQVTVMIHSGSRGFGYQICDDHLEVMERAMPRYGIRVPDRQLACAPIDSEEGRRYLGAIRCAANFAWANRQCLMHLARGVFERVFERSWEEMGMSLIYDVAHNIAKFERYTLNGGEKTVCVHRKGATRAFPPGHPEIPADYREVGQPVIIPGDMGRHSYLLAGTESAMRESFGTVCHGAGRVMSRTQAVKEAAGRSIEQELERQGIIVMGRGRHGIAEEQPAAYKDVNDVVQVVHGAGLAKRVARMRPLGVIKG